MTNTFKKVIDRLVWCQVAAAPNIHAAATSMCSDLRTDVSRNPFVYNLASAAILNRYNIITKSWQFTVNPGLGGTFGAGSSCAFIPSFSAVGTISAGSTTTRFTLSTALPSAIGVNMLANRGGSGDFGFKIRITDTTAGKTEERFIVGNTGGTTPTITVNSAFTFTPAAGARYELMSGRVMMLSAGTVASTVWRSFEVSTNSLANLTTTNLPATISTDSAFAVLDEQYTPYNHSPGEGMVKGEFTYDTVNGVAIKALTATSTAASTITGQSTGGDIGVLANEYRNFQIRIVQDTITPAAVGQRRIISSHTAGPSAVYTLGTAWTTTPSASAKFVIELPNQLLLRTTANTTVYTYNFTDLAQNNGTNSIAAGSWSTTYFGAAPGAAAAGGLWLPSFGIQPDPARNARHSHCFFFRGGAATLDLLDISASITGTWAGAVVYDGPTAVGVGTTGCYSPFGSEGRMHYINIYVPSAVNQIYRFDCKNRVLSPYTPTDFIQTGTAAVGGRMAAYAAIDGTDLYDVVLLQSHTAQACQELVVLV